MVPVEGLNPALMFVFVSCREPGRQPQRAWRIVFLVQKARELEKQRTHYTANTAPLRRAILPIDGSA